MLLIVSLIGMSQELLAKEKLAQTGMMFLSVGTDARAAGMGDAATALTMNSGALFYNPSTMANLGAMTDLSFTQVNWIADMKLNAIAACFSPFSGKYGVFGISVLSIDYGDVLGTLAWNNSDGYIDTEILKPSALAIGIGYARALSDKFAVGGQVKMVYENLGKSVTQDDNSEYHTKRNACNTIAADFGTEFKTGFKSMVFSMSVRNFSTDVKYENDNFQLPMTFRIGMAMNLMDFWKNADQQPHSLLCGIEALHPRSHSEQVNLGLEYGFSKMFFVRTGYMYNMDDTAMSYGFGLKKFGLAIDYAYTPFDILDNVQRVTLRFAY